MDRLKRLVASNRFLVWITLFIGVIGSAVAQPQFRWKWSAPDPFGNNIVGLLYTNSTYVAVCDFGRIYTTPDLTNWTAFDSGTNLALRSVAYFSGQMVAVGESGTVVLSSDLANFRPLSLGTTDWLESVAASANQLVAVGDRGAIYTSANASNWTRRTVAFTNWLRGVTFGNGRFVAVGNLDWSRSVPMRSPGKRSPHSLRKT